MAGVAAGARAGFRQRGGARGGGLLRDRRTSRSRDGVPWIRVESLLPQCPAGRRALRARHRNADDGGRPRARDHRSPASGKAGPQFAGHRRGRRSRGGRWRRRGHAGEHHARDGDRSGDEATPARGRRRGTQRADPPPRRGVRRVAGPPSRPRPAGRCRRCPRAPRLPTVSARRRFAGSGGHGHLRGPTGRGAHRARAECPRAPPGDRRGGGAGGHGQVARGTGSPGGAEARAL